MKANIGSLNKIKRTGQPEISRLTGKQYNAKYMEDLIIERKEIIEKRLLYDSMMGHNIHRLKLTDKGIELVKSLNIN
ncbi:hypothetical protein ES708_25108 [subsurface metagenome]